MTKDELLIQAGHQCLIDATGYYWARLVVWVPPIHLPQKRKWPSVCNPSIVELIFSAEGTPLIKAGLNRRECMTDWIFLQHIPDIEGVERNPIPEVITPKFEVLLRGPWKAWKEGIICSTPRS